jgi:hypothetical protein
MVKYIAFTVAETEMFERYASDLWTEEERLELISSIALNPESGDLIKETGGGRVRELVSKAGKSNLFSAKQRTNLALDCVHKDKV